MRKILLLVFVYAFLNIINANADLMVTPVQTPSGIQTPSGTPTGVPTPSGPPPTPISALDNVQKTSIVGGLAGSTVLSVSLANVDPNPVKSGDTVEVRIGIENLGGTAISNLMMEIVPEYPFILVPGENAVKNVGIVEGYQTDSNANLKIIKYTLSINKDTPAGNYELKVKYYEAGSSNKMMKNLYIDIKSMANVEVIHIDKTTLVPGEQSSLKFRINNVGNAPIRDVTFHWEDKDNTILPVGSDNTRYIKYIDVNDSYDLEYQVIADTNSKQGLYKLDLYMTYADSINGTTKQLSTLAGVYVGGGTDFDISFSENSNGESSFNVANIGSNPAYAVLVTIPIQRNWRVRGSNSAMIGNLNAGDYTLASFNLQSSNTTSNNSIGVVSQNVNSIDSNSSIVMRVSYTDTMGKRKIIDKDVEFEQIEYTNDKPETQTSQGKNIVLIVGLVIIVLLISSYRKYKKQKMIDPDLKIRDLFKK